MAFLQAAKAKVPRLLGECAFGSVVIQKCHPLSSRVALLSPPDALKSATGKDEHSLLNGYVMGYISILSGHRVVVLTSMTASHVREADTWEKRRRYQILVDEHKTVKTFGQASVVLTQEEYDWVRELAEGKCCRNGPKSDYVFHTTHGGPIHKPVPFLLMAWKDAGFEGPVNFTMIRSSVATQVGTLEGGRELKWCMSG